MNLKKIDNLNKMQNKIEIGIEKIIINKKTNTKINEKETLPLLLPPQDLLALILLHLHYLFLNEQKKYLQN